ncbi:hypothetical protein CAEBREN_05187 [Caenorhabditis brenneri]|uniref:Uncharacterized protein n=1 Tax=Caenorhabditis brenneri TaxID=135651 RepID=G0NPK0_CAEBE|nr:hypothetical protein CAEBREN_05187 [Caenorhabditis brenneri]
MGFSSEKWQNFYQWTLAVIFCNLFLIVLIKLGEFFFVPPSLPPKPAKDLKEKKKRTEQEDVKDHAKESSGKNWKGGKNGQKSRKRKHF